MDYGYIYDSASEKDIFLVNAVGNISQPKIISKTFGITMRNLNDKEISSLEPFINLDLSKLFEISSNKRTLEYRITVDNASEISSKLIDRAFYDRQNGINVSEDKLNAKLDKIYEIRNLKEIMQICDKDEKIDIDKTGIKEIDSYDLAHCYSYSFLKRLIIIEYKLPNKIKELILEFNNANMTEEDVKEELINDLLYDFIYVYNIMHFPQKDYIGISLKKINKFNEFYHTLLSPFHYKLENSEEDWEKLFNDSLKHPQYIDNYISNDENKIRCVLLLLESFRLNSHNNRLKCINYISLLEFLLTHKPTGDNDSISSQLKSKIKYCYNNQNLDTSEIDKIIYYNYNYRSDILHGNFKNINKDLNQLSKLNYISQHIKSYELEEIDKYDTKNNNILYANSLLLKSIFKNIFIYLSNNPSEIDKIKSQ